GRDRLADGDVAGDDDAVRGREDRRVAQVRLRLVQGALHGPHLGPGLVDLGHRLVVLGLAWWIWARAARAPAVAWAKVDCERSRWSSGMSPSSASLPRRAALARA